MWITLSCMKEATADSVTTGDNSGEFLSMRGTLQKSRHYAPIWSSAPGSGHTLSLKPRLPPDPSAEPGSLLQNAVVSADGPGAN